METTETPQEQFAPIPEPVLVLDAQAKYFLHTAGRWATFLGIMGFIASGLITLLALFIGTIFSAVSQLSPMGAAIPAGIGGVLTIVYLLLALLNFFMAYYLYQFGTSIKNATSFNDPAIAIKAFTNLKSHFKLIGITTIVVISLELFAIIIGILAAVVETSHH